MNDPSENRPSARTLDELDELADAVFELIWLITKNDHEAIDGLFTRIHKRHGPAAVARLCIGLSAMMLWLTELGEQSAAFLAKLDTDPHAVVDHLFHSMRPGSSVPQPLRREASQVVEVALRLTCLVNERTPQQVAEYLRTLFSDVQQVRGLISGLVMMMQAAVSVLNPWQQRALLDDKAADATGVASPREAVCQAMRRAAPVDVPPDVLSWEPSESSEVSEPPTRPFDLPPGVRQQILSAIADAAEDDEAMQAATRIAGPIILLHGERGALAVFGMLAAEVADLLGFDTIRQVNGGTGMFIPAFATPSGSHLCPESAPSLHMRCVMLGFQFVTAWANDDEREQRHLIHNRQLGAAHVITGLCYLYRQQLRYRQEIPS